VHWSKIDKVDLDQFNTIVLTGTSLMDFDYWDFDVSEIVKSGKKIIGICAGFQLLARYLGLKLARRKTVGLETITYRGESLRTFFLTHYLATNSTGVKVTGKLGDYVVAFEKDNIKAFAFHPEYNFVLGNNLLTK
jgi:GMP synthase-like glutamine amidotransferase